MAEQSSILLNSLNMGVKEQLITQRQRNIYC